jgi:outer membrane protein TolC
VRADGEAYSILAEKSACAPWQVPEEFSVYPDPRSRFFDQALSDDPALPVPGPQLYAYQLPELPERDPARFRPNLPSEPAPAAAATASLTDRPRSDSGVVQVAYVDPAGQYVKLARFQDEPLAELPAATAEADADLPLDAGEQLDELTILPIPADIWRSIPRNCLARMLEFESVRDEYQRTFEQAPPDRLRDTSQRLALEDIVQLAQINRREFQTQKELLYQRALGLSLDRFDYDLKFSTGGNGTDVNYTHNRTAGITRNTLAIPTAVTSERLLSTGGDFLARFANDVVLTFNGPDGFAADVGSSLLFDLSQRVFQRDIVFESLTQAERDVVYAAREFGRARKELFVNLADQYYGLLLTYRAIEIAAQDYFSNLRGFQQAEAEHENAGLPRFQVDQFEQQALTSRSRLISSCNALELSLDRLKLQIGLPPEMPINLNLLELEELTLGDEVTAATERVARARRRLANAGSRSEPQRDEILNEAIRLVTEALSLLEFRQRRGEQVTGMETLETELAMLRAEEARQVVRQRRRELQDVLDVQAESKTPPPPQSLIRRSIDLADALLRLAQRDLAVAERTGVAADQIAQARGQLESLRETYRGLLAELQVGKEQFEEMLQDEPELVRDAETLLLNAEGLALEVDGLLPSRRIDPEGEMQDTLEQVQTLLARSEQLLEGTPSGLVPVEIAWDEAMLTALNLRYEVMTEREQLADAWRDVKLAADELKSVLNLNASQTIRTRSDVNRPFDFTFDDSTTRLALQFDAPLNRKAQRNLYRTSLINYNRALRNLIALEDQVKFDIRNDLRQLQFQREQYRIAVASAALAYQRRVSTNLQYRLGLQNIRAFDVLEAQQDYTQSLVNLASAHIDYIQRRITLFLDLELLIVDDDQFWPELYNEQYQPTPSYQLPHYAQPAYGQLPDRVLYSHKIRRMLHVPPGQSVIFDSGQDGDDDGDNQAEPVEEIPTPSAQPLPPPVTADETLPPPPSD